MLKALLMTINLTSRQLQVPRFREMEDSGAPIQTDTTGDASESLILGNSEALAQNW